ncbi:MAG: hypothetical protein WDW38_005804 [Sanguina aurantia]
MGKIREIALKVWLGRCRGGSSGLLGGSSGSNSGNSSGGSSGGSSDGSSSSSGSSRGSRSSGGSSGSGGGGNSSSNDHPAHTPGVVVPFLCEPVVRSTTGSEDICAWSGWEVKGSGGTTLSNPSPAPTGGTLLLLLLLLLLTLRLTLIPHELCSLLRSSQIAAADDLRWGDGASLQAVAAATGDGDGAAGGTEGLAGRGCSMCLSVGLPRGSRFLRSTGCMVLGSSGVLRSSGGGWTGLGIHIV